MFYSYESPFNELRKLQDEFNRVFGNIPRKGTARNQFPPVNMWNKDDEIIVAAELPGFATEDIDISVQDKILTIQGKRKNELEENKTNEYHRRERPYGTFKRLVNLPFPVEMDKVTAEYANGVLEIKLQRAEKDKPRRIAIQAQK